MATADTLTTNTDDFDTLVSMIVKLAVDTKCYATSTLYTFEDGSMVLINHITDTITVK